MADTNQNIATIQSSIKNTSFNSEEFTKRALFLGGLNVTHEALKQYDPLKTGYGRLFMVRSPLFVETNNVDKFKNFKHILEYGNTAVQGLTDITVNFQQVTGGYAGRSFEVPTHTTDGMTTFTVTVYEFSGSPVREMLHAWINGSHDILSGFKHYNGLDSSRFASGATDTSVERILANETAEFIYVATDDTGESIEYACLLANCFPEGLNTDAFNYNSGEHNLVTTDIVFHCVKYESIQINHVAQRLIDKFKVLSNSLNLYSGYKASDTADDLGGRASFGYNVFEGTLDHNVRANIKSDSNVKAEDQSTYYEMYEKRNTPFDFYAAHSSSL